MSNQKWTQTSDDPYWNILPPEIQAAITRMPGSIPYAGHGPEYMVNLDEVEDDDSDV